MAELNTSQVLSLVRTEVIQLVGELTGQVNTLDFCKTAEVDINWTFSTQSPECSFGIESTADPSYFFIDSTVTIEDNDLWYYLPDTQPNSGWVIKHKDWDFWENVKFTITEESGKIKFHVSGTIGNPKQGVSTKIIQIKTLTLSAIPRTQTHTLWHILDGSWNGSRCIGNVGNLVFENNNKLQISGDKLILIALEDKPNSNTTLHLKGLVNRW